jgi:hypothetical protein
MNLCVTRGNKKEFPISRTCIAIISLLCRVFWCSWTAGHLGSSVKTLHHARSAHHFTGFRILTPGGFVWSKKSCSLVDRYHSFGGTCCLIDRIEEYSAMKTERQNVGIYQTKWCHFLEFREFYFVTLKGSLLRQIVSCSHRLFQFFVFLITFEHKFHVTNL